MKVIYSYTDSCSPPIVVKLLQTPEYYQPPAPVLYPKNVPLGEPPPPPPPRPDRHAGGPPHPAPPPIQGPKPQAAVAKKYSSH
ncbi:hypothetical protein BIW11_11213, partial [Tropilaelaps mercedesae]